MEKFVKTYDLVPVDHDPFAGPAILRSVPTTEAQREIWAAAEMGNEASCAYNESVSLELLGHLYHAALDKAVHLVCDRHEALHSVIAPGGARYLVLEQVRMTIEQVDLVMLGGPGQQERLSELARTDMRTPFDLVHGPLLRIKLVLLASDRHLLRITGHHIICDGWSLGILMAEISAAYSALVKGEHPELPDAQPFSAYAQALFRLPGPRNIRRCGISGNASSMDRSPSWTCRWTTSARRRRPIRGTAWTPPFPASSIIG